MRIGGRLFGLFLLGFSVCSLLAQNPAEQWPQWRGPHMNGTSKTASSLPVKWSETENVVWRVKLPNWAAATPVIWEDTLFITSAQEGFTAITGTRGYGIGGGRPPAAPDGVDKTLLLALDRETGKERWRVETGDGNHIENKQNMTSPSPVTDGTHVWVMTGTGVLSCFDFNGKRIWQRNIVEDYGRFGLNFGYASSPLLHEGRLYLQVLHGMKTDDPSYVLGIDAATGRTLWHVERPTDAVSETPDSYSTPMMAQVDGVARLVVSGAGYLTVHDLDSGKELSRAGGLDPTKERNYRTIASSVVEGDVVFAPSRRRPFIAFRLHEQGNAEPQPLWSTEYGPDVPTPTFDGELLYIVDDRGIALCLRGADGEIVWDRNRLEPGTYSASPVLADGKIYATNEEGTTTVFRAGPEFEILSVNKLNDYTLASPAIVGEHIFVRTANYLYCLGNKDASSD